MKTIDRDFFKIWTSNMAYILGFFAADGSIDINGRGGSYFSFHTADEDILKQIKYLLQSDHKIAFRADTNMYRLQVGSKGMVEDLISLGLNPRKTHSLSLMYVPSQFLGDFVRGYFDGDGNVWIGKVHKERKTPCEVIQTVFTSCSRNFLEQLREKLQERGLGRGCFYCSTSRNFCRLQYSINDSKLLAHLMYDNLSSDLFLDRKKKRFDTYFAGVA